MAAKANIKKNSIFNIIKTCSSILFPLITFPYVSRILGPDSIGKISFAQSFVSYFALIASLGIGTYAIRACSVAKKDKNELNRVSSEIFTINLLTTLVAYVAMFLTIAFSSRIDAYRYLIIVECSTILFTSLGADWLNSAMEDFKYIAIRTVAFQLLSLVCMFIFVRSSDDYLTYAIICVVSSSGANVMNMIYRRKYCKTVVTFNINWKTHLPPIFFLFVMSLSQTIMQNADVTMLGLMKSDYDVGLYTTANKMVRLAAQLVQSLAFVIIPRLSIYFLEQDYDSINAFLRKVLNFNITLGLPITIGIEMMASDIVYILGGAEYIEAVPVIRVLILSFTFSLVGGSFLGSAVMIPSGKEKYYMVVCLITAGLNVLINFLLIPSLGAIGASIATASNGFLIFILLLFKVDKRIRVQKIWNVFLAPIIGCLCIAVCCLLCSAIPVFWLRVIFSVAVSVLAYGIILLAFKNEFVIDALSNIKTKMFKKKEK